MSARLRPIPERSMSLQWPARSGSRSRSLAWSNPVVKWWGLLTFVSAINIAVWFVLYSELQDHRTSLAVWSLLTSALVEQRTSGPSSASLNELMLLLSAAYVFGCAFRSFLPRADVQRI